jgi:5-methyltetrahydropteroyltriglutamate--homocysteine methyltransferase
MATPANLGFPRIGPKRELKRALERFWAGEIDERELDQACRAIRQQNWQLQRDAGMEHIPSNDFSLYDHVLDTSAMVGAVPSRFGWSGELVDLTTYFAMARGAPGGQDNSASPLEMTKWFDTNYHYLVPEFTPDMTFQLASTKPVDELREARSLGIETRPVLLGPVTYLVLGKCDDDEFDRMELLEPLLPVYHEVLSQLACAGARWVQIDEPSLVLDLSPQIREAFRTAYDSLRRSTRTLSLLVATYFGDVRDNLDLACSLPVDALHIDLVRGRGQLAEVLAKTPDRLSLSLGAIDGRNVWRADLGDALQWVRQAAAALGPDRVMVAPSCPLVHCPYDADQETELDPEVRSWLAFAKQKLYEIALLARGINEGESGIQAELQANRQAMASRRKSTRVHNDQVRARASAVTDRMLHRRSPYPERKKVQQKRLALPQFPTTTIGSFPQTKGIRAVRAELVAGKQSRQQYEAFLREQIEQTIRFQEQIGLDVLVHGEPERNDMVEYFGQQLEGFAFTRSGWVQSYGSRCVKPPIIFGDVSRPRPMTVDWIKYAQSLTSKPVKGMLTGPVTMLQWSFVRDDQPRSETCRQIALALRDEVADLEAAGICVIQIDEAALREGLPLRQADWAEYLRWAVECFRLTSSGVRDETQIHTHMCYSQFNDIIQAISAMDADVISIESSRSRMELLRAFVDFRYPSQIGPGVYDIHSPRVPSKEEMVELLRGAQQVLSPDQLWVNPDCGLKTRSWDQVRPALGNMVQAAKEVRALQGTKGT